MEGRLVCLPEYILGFHAVYSIKRVGEEADLRITERTLLAVSALTSS